MERKFQFSIGGFYHIFNRGNDKRVIFLNDTDKERFIKLLFVCNGTEPVVFKTIQGLPLDKIERGETLVDVGTYCLVPNHFHLLIREKIENGISMFMEKLSTAYSMYFNKKNKRTGKLFENTFKASHANNDNYLKYLFAYIHLNPVKLIDTTWKEIGISDTEKTKNFLQNYKYSSYPDYINIDRPESVIINKDVFPEYFVNKKEFTDFIEDWLRYKTIQGLPLDVV